MNMRRWYSIGLLLPLLLVACGGGAPVAMPPAVVTSQTAQRDSVAAGKYLAAQPTVVRAAPALSAARSMALDTQDRTGCCSTGGTNPVNGEPYDATFFENYGTNPFIDTEDDHKSTFGMDVDTASYTIIRRYLTDGNLPDKDAVRTEEVVNYFTMHYPEPTRGTFGISMEGAPSVFGGEKYWLVQIGIQGRRIEVKDRKDAVLTFVVDVSGSMNIENRLGLVKQALRLLVDQLRPADQVALVVFGTNARVILEPTPATQASAILAAIDQLQAEGSTNTEEGLVAGYQLASQAFKPGATNRLILCADGVANEGHTSADEILRTTEDYAKRGITLSTVGFGMNNYNDVLLERLADKGDGNYAYVDTLEEAQRIFVQNLTGTLQVIAKDAKIQVDFNPKVVKSYRLLGYENRDIADNQFRNDKVDAGEVGGGGSVTALYELKLQDNPSGDALVTHVRYQEPDTGQVTELAQTLQREDFRSSFEAASPQFHLATAAAEYAEILRHSFWAKDSKMSNVLALAQRVQAEMPEDKDVAEFVGLVERANELMK